MSGTCRHKLLFITGNKHKVEEANNVLADTGICLEQAPGYKYELQLDSLTDIALHAALEAYRLLGKPLVVEDAGLFINALSGFPGPYSSYVYQTIGVEGVLRLLEGIGDRSAYFLSSVAVIYPPLINTYTGRVDGWITEKPRGSRGFGFDPIFVPRGADKTFAEMSVDEKNRYSHRAKALRAMARDILRVLG